MISRFKASLGYIKSMMDEDTYHTAYRTDFENRFVEPFESSDSVVDNHKRFPPDIFDNGSFKDLNPGLVTLSDPVMNLNGVTHNKLGYFFFELLFFQLLELL